MFPIYQYSYCYLFSDINFVLNDFFPIMLLRGVSMYWYNTPLVVKVFILYRITLELGVKKVPIRESN